MIFLAADETQFNLESILETIKSAIQEHTPSILAALATLIIGWLVAKMVRGFSRRVMRKARVDETLLRFLANIVYAILMVFVIISALGRLGVETSSFVAIIGAAGLAIGFALQGSLSNLAAGVMMIMFRPFKVGDLVETGGTVGTIEDIQIFSTVINTQDNKKVILPNSMVMGDRIVNLTGNATRRVDLTAGIGYGDDIPKAKAELERILAEHPKVLSNPEPKVAVVELADSSVNFIVRPWCKTEHYWDVHFDVTEQIKLSFDKAGISIPFPQQDVHMHQVA